MPSRSTAPRLKMIVRRLPPGLTQAEFEAAMGEEWNIHRGKVKWAVYKPGRISKDVSKPSKPLPRLPASDEAGYVNELAERVRSAAFNDGKGSAKDSALLGAPCVEFAPYGRIPSNKHRKDLRQGTIDEDREFIDFLESLTNPLTKTATADQENEPASTVREKVTTTPLVQYLKDKKANKGKEVSASSKTTKHGRQDSKDGKVTPSSDKKVSQKGTPMTPPDKKSAQAIKVENAARDAVKALNKQATDTQKPLAPPGPAPAAPAASAESASSAMAEKKRERGN